MISTHGTRSRLQQTLRVIGILIKGTTSPDLKIKDRVGSGLWIFQNGEDQLSKSSPRSILTVLVADDMPKKDKIMSTASGYNSGEVDTLPPPLKHLSL